MKVVAVVPARNEQKTIGNCLCALRSQTVKLERIVVVDDGSTDCTGRIAKFYATDIIRCPFHEESLVGKPKLAERFNLGLRMASESRPDFVLICGADTLLPSDYVEKVTANMKLNPKIAVASGRIPDEPFNRNVPRGTGRVVDAK